MQVSIIIRTLNEATHLGDLLAMIARQAAPGLTVETVVIDSGSTDGTQAIATAAGARLTHITKADFSFGRSLNRGCACAGGDLLVFISGHCVPADAHWLARLVAPLRAGQADYSYGRQVGDDASNFAERRIFAKYFPDRDAIPQKGFFCNNANAALTRAAWDRLRFDEDLTGLEDMELAQRLVTAGGAVAYVAGACVYHHHAETWAQVGRRFEREAMALRRILPDVTLSRLDVARYVVSSVWMDWVSALRLGRLWRNLIPVLRYRIAQYAGSRRGNQAQRRLSQAEKDAFFYPSVPESETTDAWLKPHRRPPAHEGQQPAGEG